VLQGGVISPLLDFTKIQNQRIRKYTKDYIFLILFYPEYYRAINNKNNLKWPKRKLASKVSAPPPQKKSVGSIFGSSVVNYL
jgi:hypothetical protein